MKCCTSILLVFLLSLLLIATTCSAKVTTKPPTPTGKYGITLPTRRGLLELTFTSTIIWISIFFFFVWILVQAFQYILYRGYHSKSEIPIVKLRWFPLFKLTYNSQSDDLRRKINAYWIKGIVYPAGLACAAWSLSVLYSGDNSLTAEKIPHIEVLRAMTVFLIGMMIFEILYRTHSSLSMIIHHWAAVLDCILVLYWDYENLAFLKIAAIFAIFVALEGAECFVMMFYRAFGDTKALMREEVKSQISKVLQVSQSGFDIDAVYDQFDAYRRAITPWMLFVAISDLLLKFVQHIIVLVLYITHWNDLSLELRIVFGITFLIFVIVQLYSPYIYTMIWMKLRRENETTIPRISDDLEMTRAPNSTGYDYQRITGEDIEDTSSNSINSPVV
ncbi:Exoc6 [Acrasis kona]|uniref:Exoc6 n=1 Tax=Acrasis kona TaxID=1008807 RepID=A0AAW2YH37_9EUKA